MTWELKMEKAIHIIDVDASYVASGNSFEDCEITWTNGTTPISKEDIKEEMDKL